MDKNNRFHSRFFILACLCIFLFLFSACGEETDSLISQKPRLAAAASEADLKELAAGNNAFAFDLYQELREGEGNLLFSPYSLSQALAMVYGGAREETAQQMADVLHFTLPQGRLHPAFNSLDISLTQRSQETAQDPDAQETPEPGFELNIANAVWGQKGYPFLPEYLDLLAQNYGAGLRLVDFKGNTEGVIKEINQWVSNETQGRIQDIINDLGKDTGLVLANAIYFNAQWDLPFDKDLTIPEPFYLFDGSVKQTPLMHQTAKFLYTETAGFQAIELPYANPDFSMVILLPREGQFEGIEGKLGNEWVHGILQEFEWHEVILTMPKFRFEPPTTKLKDIFSKMGMPEAFTPNANFFGIIEQQPGLLIYIGDVLHKAFIEVDEEKTEAAAASVVVIVEASMLEDETEPITMRIDRPFIFFIRDRETGTILFLGRVMDPAG